MVLDPDPDRNNELTNVSYEYYGPAEKERDLWNIIFGDVEFDSAKGGTDVNVVVVVQEARPGGL